MTNATNATNSTNTTNAIHAILTIDDIASENTRSIVDYLKENDIPALMFAWGENVLKHYDNAIYALKNGVIVGNHSYSHPFFSKITLDEAKDEIEKNEEVLNRLYKDAGVIRKYRPFRFPYGDRGGDNKDALQDYLRERGFDKLKDTQIPYPFWKEKGYDKDIDTYWTFDFKEYRIRKDSGFTKEDVIRRMNDPEPKEGAPLFEDNASHIFLIHAHDDTEEMAPGYFMEFIDRLIDKGVIFDRPEFI